MRARRISVLLAWRGRALMLGASMGAIAVAASAAFAQDIIELDPITVLSTKLPQTAIDSLAGISTLREEQLREIAADRPAQCSMRHLPDSLARVAARSTARPHRRPSPASDETPGGIATRWSDCR